MTTRRYPLGQPFQVRLPSNPSTGYSWDVKTTPGLEIVDSFYQSPRSAIGAGEEAVWIVRGTQRGTQAFTGWYRRPWEQDVVQPEVILFRIS